MMVKYDNIELRSEKVKDIIGQVPPVLIRFGNGIIFFIFLGILCCFTFIKYDHIIETETVIVSDSNIFIAKIRIPPSDKQRIIVGQKVILYLDNKSSIFYDRFEFFIDNMPKTTYINNNEPIILLEKAIRNPIQSEHGNVIFFSDSCVFKTEILTNKESILNSFISQFDILNKTH